MYPYQENVHESRQSHGAQQFVCAAALSCNIKRISSYMKRMIECISMYGRMYITV